MKTLTLSVADDLYQQANQKATELDTSLPEVVQDLLVQWTTTKAAETTLSSYDAEQRRKELDKLFAITDAKPKLPGSVGPFNREELYQRGISAEPDSSTDQSVANNIVGSDAEQQRREELQRFLDELNAKPRQPGPSVGPLNREELYQRGIPGY
jgi:hypothetical protein